MACYFGINRVQNSLFNFQGSSASRRRNFRPFFEALEYYTTNFPLCQPLFEKKFLPNPARKNAQTVDIIGFFGVLSGSYEKTFGKIFSENKQINLNKNIDVVINDNDIRVDILIVSTVHYDNTFPKRNCTVSPAGNDAIKSFVLYNRKTTHSHRIPSARPSWEITGIRARERTFSQKSASLTRREAASTAQRKVLLR